MSWSTQYGCKYIVGITFLHSTYEQRPQSFNVVSEVNSYLTLYAKRFWHLRPIKGNCFFNLNSQIKKKNSGARDFKLILGTMFPFHRSNELVFQVRSDPHHQHQIPQDLILGHASLDGSKFNTKTMGKGRRRKLCDSLDKSYGNFSDNSDKKHKMMHREIERQRRQEMATLYVSLRSYLPLEFIKVKDHYFTSSSSFSFFFVLAYIPYSHLNS
jgi:hypothetical protein